MSFRDEAQEQQFHQLTAQLRCPKCQNNSIADSNAMIAIDMRQKVYALLQEGKSSAEISDYMVARYGNFVTYDPPLTPLTLLLWVLPAVAIGYGGWAIFRRSRRQIRSAPDVIPAAFSADERRASAIVYLPGIAAAMLLSLFFYQQTGHYRQVYDWRQVIAQTPALLERLQNPKAQPLNEEELVRLALGLRTRLHSDAGNVEEWIMLGRIGMVLGNANQAIGAFENAWRLAPQNEDARRGYEKALILSPDPEDNRRGKALLRQQETP
jgi:cytochrome c-type biogenesis protein CcmH